MILLIVTISIVVFASVFIYNPVTLTVDPQSPPALLSCLHDPVCQVSRTSRVALSYTDFEVYSTPGWISMDGLWSLVSELPGSKGNVLLGNDNNQGVGGASFYNSSTSFSGYNDLWVILKTRYDKEKNLVSG